MYEGMEAYKGWAAAWWTPNPDHFIFGVVGHTRTSVWDDLLRSWFRVEDQEDREAGLLERRYVHDTRGKTVRLDRHHAVQFLYRRGLRVVRVIVHQHEPGLIWEGHRDPASLPALHVKLGTGP